MNISTTARHYELASDLRNYAEEKVQNLTRYFDHIVNAHIVFSLEKYRHKAEITIHVNGADMVAIEESDDMYVSVDRVIDKLERQLRKHKDKIRRRTHERIADVPEERVEEEYEGTEAESGEQTKEGP